MLNFREAAIEDAPSIAALVNAAYRGESSKQGWTTEAHILDGLRTSESEIQQLIKTDNSTIMVCTQGNDLIGSIYLHKIDCSAHIGMFVLNPDFQV